ncbi:MAG: hypothetical protein Q9221_000729 [Calogaya cf. arnoldii]
MRFMKHLDYQAGNQNGNIGIWHVSLNVDGETWHQLNDTFPDDEQLKTVDLKDNARPVPARLFNLTVYTEAGNRGPRSSAAEINLSEEVLPPSDDLSNVQSSTTIAALPTSTIYAAPHRPTEQSNKSSPDGAHDNDDGGLDKVQAIGTVIGTIAGIVAVVIAIHICCGGR